MTPSDLEYVNFNVNFRRLRNIEMTVLHVLYWLMRAFNLRDSSCSFEVGNLKHILSRRGIAVALRGPSVRQVVRWSHDFEAFLSQAILEKIGSESELRSNGHELLPRDSVGF